MNLAVVVKVELLASDEAHQVPGCEIDVVVVEAPVLSRARYRRPLVRVRCGWIGARR